MFFFFFRSCLETELIGSNTICDLLVYNSFFMLFVASTYRRWIQEMLSGVLSMPRYSSNAPDTPTEPNARQQKPFCLKTWLAFGAEFCSERNAGSMLLKKLKCPKMCQPPGQSSLETVCLYISAGSWWIWGQVELRYVVFLHGSSAILR